MRGLTSRFLSRPRNRSMICTSSVSEQHQTRATRCRPRASSDGAMVSQLLGKQIAHRPLVRPVLADGGSKSSDRRGFGREGRSSNEPPMHDHPGANSAGSGVDLTRSLSAPPPPFPSTPHRPSGQTWLLSPMQRACTWQGRLNVANGELGDCCLSLFSMGRMRRTAADNDSRIDTRLRRRE